MQNSFVRTVTAIALGAIPGALGRYFITEFTKATIGKDFSYYGTFFINVTGCFIIALFYTLNEEKLKSLSPEIRLMIATGFCGAYTTFSTYGLETFTQIDKGNTTVALIYWLFSMVVGMLAVQLGVILGRLNSQSNSEPN
ncbi:fluoride efflux transporter CrcB [Tolypothrix sp. PCC 7910]|uniref:fluoride efflux transporter CrcB n=1 Tax=Tolypothrix sp. PCC 7910 TaxID=2099387 RepID=UPI0014277F3E|nr:fluoride efflux transporter CrcB [Tolypothrix sp. PCC 7910]QIR36325.1 fluoride efflux transporter CrcB [Tolypothrix sp. PCC 7910]